ncbi:peroxiredoxin-2E-1, chloroplastic-like [Chenopodium quinoa]|uniref:Glutaredoxin-dependent peroxiredoxin n=1 Tax=Chenopodium quinoa TaxID=63459 RepID=A0A803MZP4_CHEQI|nr:peroxiredoxin-2E-1, chloroplastic-like [Chenopodium quinoa]
MAAFTATTAAAAATRLFSLSTPKPSLFRRNNNLLHSTLTPSFSLNLKPSSSLKPLNYSTKPTITAAISVGSKLPDATLSFLDASDEVQTVTISALTTSKKAILFAVPGAFTPTCSQKHVPGFIAKASELKSKGVDIIACISVNDAFVMKAWKESLNVGDEVMMLSDGNGDFTRAIGAELDLSDKPIGLGVRSKRYAMLVEDGVVKVLNMEDGGAFTFSGAEDMLKVL